MPESSFAFNQPINFVLGYGIILACLVLPALKIWRLWATSASLKELFGAWQGMRWGLLVLLGMGVLVWVGFETHTGFWTLRILDAQRASLDYWYPRANRLVAPGDIRALKLITTQYDVKEDTAHRRWTIALTTRDGEEYTSVQILTEDKAQQAMTALERWSGHSRMQYLRRGMFGHLQPLAP